MTLEKSTRGPELLTTGEAAAILGLGPGMVRVLANTGRLPALRTSTGLRLYRRRDVDRLRAARDAAARARARVRP